MDNSTASRIANNSIQQRRLRSMDMRFYWVRDRVQQGRFIIYLKPDTQNRGDFYTKHHPPTHCRLRRKCYIHQEGDTSASQGLSPTVLQGYANLGISLGTRTKHLTTRSRNQNRGLTLSPII